MSIKKITIVGTGVMGHPMAAHLLEAGYDLTVFARHREKIEDLLEKGAHYADTLKDAAKDADAIITMLPTEDIVKENIFCENGFCCKTKKSATLSNLNIFLFCLFDLKYNQCLCYKNLRVL